MKKIIFSLLLGIVFSIPAAAVVVAACPPVVVDDKGKRCLLVGASDDCDGGVCVCAYNCGPTTELPSDTQNN